MARLSFDTAVSTMNNSDTNNNTVGFLSLKNDGDEAIVRIMHDSVNDFDIVTLHPITLGGKFRSVSCVRNDPREPVDNCPLCKNGTKIQSRIFIHMIQYTTNAQGQIEAKPVVWERPVSYATKLKNDIAEYGPLSSCIFKVKRNGKAGDKNTTYELKLGNPNMYNEASYPKIDNAFANYSACGTIVMDKTYDEISEFLATGNFPESKKESTTNQTNTPNVDTPRGNWHGGATNGGAPTTGGYAPNGTGSAPARPTRYY